MQLGHAVKGVWRATSDWRHIQISSHSFSEQAQDHAHVNLGNLSILCGGQANELSSISGKPDHLLVINLSTNHHTMMKDTMTM
jgi:hypothetical protein